MILSPRFLAAAMVALAPAGALAFEHSLMTLPVFAAAPQFGERGLSPWGYAFDGQPWSFNRTGAAFATTQSFTPLKGTNWLLGVQSSTGTVSGLAMRGPALGYDVSATSVKLGYNMGRLVPYLEVNSAFARPTFPGIGVGAGSFAPGEDRKSTRLNSSHT